MHYVNDRLSRKRELEARTMRFGVAVLKFIDSLPHSHSTKVVVNQVGRSAISIGANYREANRAESRNDFVHKIGIVLKECSETVYWLEVLSNLGVNPAAVEDLLAEAKELTCIFQSSNRSLRTPKSDSPSGTPAPPEPPAPPASPKNN